MSVAGPGLAAAAAAAAAACVARAEVASAEVAFAPLAEMDSLQQREDTSIETKERSEKAGFL